VQLDMGENFFIPYDAMRSFC